MAINTLTEGNKYSTTTLDKVIIDRLVKDSPELELLPFESLLGNSLTFDVITTDSLANFYSPGDTWTESTPALTQDTVTLKILGGDADIDNFLLDTRSNQTDLKGTVLDNRIKAVQYTFIDNFYYGSATSNPKKFSGLHLLMTSTTYNTVNAGAGTGTALSVDKLRQALDLVREAGHAPSVCMMSYAMRRGLSKYLDSIGSAFPAGRDWFGRPCELFDGVPIKPTSHIVNTETASGGAYAAQTTGANTSIFFLEFAPQSCCGVQGSSGIVTKPLGDLETKDAQRWRIKWYTAIKLERIRSCSKVDGIVAAGTVTA